MDHRITKPDGTKVDVDLECWKRWQKEFEEILLKGKVVLRYAEGSDKPAKVQVHGISKEVLYGIELFDVGASGEMSIRSSKGLVDLTSIDVKGWALSRWLVEHSEDRNNPTFREQKSRLELLRAALYAKSLLEEIEERQPDAERGKRSIEGASNRGGVATDKAEVMEIVKRIHEGYDTIADLEKASELSAYKKKWSGRDTIRRWIKAAIPDRKWTGRKNSAL